MAQLTTDPKDPRLGHGTDEQPTPQAEVYLVLSEEERKKGFVRPVRRSYIHVGPAGPKYPLRDLTDNEAENWQGSGYVKFEIYPESELPKTGKFWTQEQLDQIGRGCRTVTSTSQDIAETYARRPSFYGATYCMGCQKHLPVSEFVWADDGQIVGS